MLDLQRDANEIWQADHTELDILVLDETGAPVRPWLTVVIDDHSRAVAAYRVSAKAPSALQTALALPTAIWRKGEPGWTVCGIPEVLYTDHGSEDIAEVRVCRGDSFLCRAICQELAGETVSLKDIVRARTERRQALQSTIENRRSLVDQVLARPGAASTTTVPFPSAAPAAARRGQGDPGLAVRVPAAAFAGAISEQPRRPDRADADDVRQRVVLGPHEVEPAAIHPAVPATDEACGAD